VTDTVTVGRNPTGVAVGSGAVWVTNGSDGTVTRLDLRNLTKPTTIRVGGSPTAVAAAPDGIWVTQG
jgi:DNA-binding beta-propeller fold protein YncE